MTPLRRVDNCLACGEPREIAARGLCFTCYRRESRSAERVSKIDRHNPGIRREQKKTIRAYAQVLGGLADLAVGHDAVREILDILRPYLALISDFLPIVGPVNGEQEVDEFTVHSDQDSAGVNGGPDARFL